MAPPNRPWEIVMLRLVAVAVLALGAGQAFAAGIIDQLEPFVGKNVQLSTGRDVKDATITKVGDRYFCADVHVPGFEQKRCYNDVAVSFIRLPKADQSLWIAVIEPH